MKKSALVAMILGTVGGVFFALGMCMVLLPEWGMFNQGIACGVIGLVILLVDLLIWRRMEGKAPIHVTPKAVGTVVVGVLGALLLGVGMCLSMVFGNMVLGIAVGIAGIIVLLLLIPLLRESGDFGHRRNSIGTKKSANEVRK